MFQGKRTPFNAVRPNKVVKKTSSVTPTNETTILKKDNVEKIKILTDDIALIKDGINKLTQDIDVLSQNIIKLSETSNKKFDELSNILLNMQRENPKPIITVQPSKKINS